MKIHILQISALWDFFCFNVPRTTAEQCRGAFCILCMAAKSSSGILGSHLQDIIDIGFGRWAKVDPLLARTACTALQRLSEDDKKKLLASNGSRVFGILESLITGSWLPENIWYSAADKAIGAIYTLHPAPEIVAARLVKKSQSSVFDCDESNNLQSGEGSGIAHAPTTVQVGKLSRYLFVISHVAMHQLVYIESCVRKVQKQRAKKEKLGSEANSDVGSHPGNDAPKVSLGSVKLHLEKVTFINCFLVNCQNAKLYLFVYFFGNTFLQCNMCSSAYYRILE